MAERSLELKPIAFGQEPDTGNTGVGSFHHTSAALALRGIFLAARLLGGCFLALGLFPDFTT